ncbi:efflux RND transporter periplasmic adaptor subunit [Pseudomonas protegens]|jgi:membrane fusion protein (multidrug efflux system)|uniref:Efflux RND transporter periplasmic adaptor subunit n=2 Tax=Pseudomonas protegens TaxID=380021 RepID=A0ABY2VNG1_9PSED|nr:efflux RND transporter periplasmic adaptor subunit [Pseudomonas protegens]ASE22935.1 MexH family multidrug efflux RND transporter periplasmic adaptor subunit [Pseudomonas protegens]QEZ53371.1 efflux RND transporter periplasmic adaptor subunit [Pseudomonas protegens]QEZ60419.1 efflux RND transporter periplasmic adaptor subunit [Pseudomonas protegens]QEZ64658.1 efflux RND transporter periplasmic adaptor subunit [Pseudomonas protegens]QIC31449.1 efflux RND transporter periplasmic adaptor subun
MADVHSSPSPAPPGAAPQAPRKRRLLRPMLIMLGVVLLIVAVIGGVKFAQISKLIAQAKVPLPPAVVTAIKAQYEEWQPSVSAVGSMKTVRGVDVTTEVGGIVRSIGFKPGQEVAAGDLLVQLNADSDIAQLHSLEATAALAGTVLKRDRAQLKVSAVSQALVEADEADLKAKLAAAEQQRALVAKKSIRAPFAGRIGITAVNPGQYLNPGDKIANLQTFDPIYIDFNVPQAQVQQVALGQSVTVSADGLPKQTFTGRVSSIDTQFDPNTRNVTVEATIDNPKRSLVPGMFARAVVASGGTQRYLTLPQTAVTYNPYGTTVFIASQKNNDQGDAVLTAQQTFIETGPNRGDQVAVLSGVKEGDLVITSGQMKLKNGSPVKVDNSHAPRNDPSPTPQEH